MDEQALILVVSMLGPWEGNYLLHHDLKVGGFRNGFVAVQNLFSSLSLLFQVISPFRFDPLL